MFKIGKLFRAGIAAIAISAVTYTVSQAELYRVSTVAPGLSPFIVNTAIAKLVNSKLDDVDMRVRSTGAATKHVVEAANGKVDFFFSSPTLNWLMINDIGPYAKVKDSNKLEEKLGLIFTYQIGAYHYITRADSGIETLEDIRGKKVFIGPPGSGAQGAILLTLKAAFDLTAKDMDVQPFGFDAAIQAFQDDKIDMIVLPTNIPSPSIQQFALTKEIRLLDFPVEKLNKIPNFELIGGTVNEIPAGSYGENHIGDTVRTHGALANFSAAMHVDEEVVYQVTKTIWENIDELYKAAAWMPNAIQLENALNLIPSRLHPGAERYYREIGMKIPEPVDYRKGG